MDSKIIVAIIISVAMLACVYMYTSSTPFNVCMSVYMSKPGMGMDATGAMQQCGSMIYSH